MKLTENLDKKLSENIQRENQLRNLKVCNDKINRERKRIGEKVECRTEKIDQQISEWIK